MAGYLVKTQARVVIMQSSTFTIKIVSHSKPFDCTEKKGKMERNLANDIIKHHKGTKKGNS